MEGVDFKKIFSLVVKHASIRVSLAIPAIHEMNFDQLDVNTSFLHGKLEKELLMT